MVAEDSLSCEERMAVHHISVPKLLANGDVNKRFKICCKANGWNLETCALKLPTLLKGEAITVWLELREEQQGDYEIAKKEICRAMMPMEFFSLDRFHQWKLWRGKAILVFVHDFKKLLEQAMPGLEKSA